MAAMVITAGDVTKSVNNTQNWKAPGPDGIQNFWIKRFTTLHRFIAERFSEFVRYPEKVPTYLSRGVTYLLPKGKTSKDPAKYRPITCLCTLYKILTSCIAEKIYCHLQENSLLAEEQKGCIRGSQGCKEQLIIDAVVMEQAVQKHRNINTAFIDYKKAFDSVPHSWLISVLSMYKIHPLTVSLLKHLMSSWSTVLQVESPGGRITSSCIPIRRGIFQGDSLSPLWFCLALNPLSFILNQSGYGYNLKGSTNLQCTLSHLMYMDDIKLYAASERQLKHLLALTEMFSADVQMSFGLDKCKTLSIQHGKIHPTNFVLGTGEAFHCMDESDAYKYLGLVQTKRLNHKEIRGVVTDEYLKRVSAVLKSRIDGRSTFKAINTYAVPVLTYTFGIVKWSNTELESLARSTRKLLTRYRVHHPKSAVERLIMPRNRGGRGLTDIYSSCQRQIQSLRNFFLTHTSFLHKVVVSADDSYTPLDLCHTGVADPRLEHDHIATIQQRWLEKPLHGRHAHDLNNPFVCREASNAWLNWGGIFAETEGFMLAIQDQCVATKNYLKYVVKENLENDTCRRCHKASETIQHVTSACQALVATHYLHRHNQVAGIIHQNLACLYNLLPSSVPYYQYTPSAVLENRTHKLYWDRSVLTDKTIPNNRPDIILIDKQEQITFLIDIGIPNTHNLKQYSEEKMLKYLPLAEEIKQLWRQEKVAIVPLVMSATGVIPKELSGRLKELGISAWVLNLMQKSVILNTTSIVRSFLNIPQ